MQVNKLNSGQNPDHKAHTDFDVAFDRVRRRCCLHAGHDTLRQRLRATPGTGACYGIQTLRAGNTCVASLL